MDKKTTRAKQDIKERKSGSSRVVYFFPFLFSLFPVTAMLSVNAGQVPVTAGWRIALGSVTLAAFLLFIIQVILKNWMKASLITTLVLALVFSFGHVFGVLEGVKLGSIILGSNKFLLPVYAIVLIGGMVGIFSLRNLDSQFSALLNIFSIILILVPIVQLTQFGIKANASLTSSPSISLPSGEIEKPNVYFIVLDGYDRADTLERQYGFDNSGFLEELEAIGFVIPRCAQSNFAWTPLSMATTFHMSYLENEIALGRTDGLIINYAQMANLIRHNPVRQIFESYGYEIISFENGYSFTEWNDADRFFSPTYGGEYRGLSMFEAVFIRSTTIMRSFTNQQAIALKRLSNEDDPPAHVKFEQVMFTLDELNNITREKGPKFVYAHIMSPHSPWVFDEMGNLALQDRNPGYVDEISYLNTRILDLVTAILSSSEIPPIIIQSDHGWEWEGRLANLNALYLPGGVGSQVTEDWTPVNTFRLIFREYFGLDYPMLPNRSYLSPIEARMDLSPAPMTCQD